MKQEIQNNGVVKHVSDGIVRVLVEQRSACSGCHAAGFCSSADCKDRIIEVRVSDASAYVPGDAVHILAAPGMGRKAVLLSFVLPLILLLVGATVFIAVCRWSEGWAALGSLGVVVVYYVLLYFAEPRLRNSMTYSLEKINE